MGDERDLYLSPEWCDWRWRIYDCQHTRVWQIFYIAHTAWAALAITLGVYVVYRQIYRRVWSTGSSLFHRNLNGGWQPRPTESWIMFSIVHLFLRGLYTLLILYDLFPNQAWAEFAHELPWSILYTGGVCFIVGLIYATPRVKHSLSPTRVVLPSEKTLNAILVIYGLAPILSLPFIAAADGYYRDHQNFERANILTRFHYGLWSFYCWALAGVNLWFGIKLVRLMRSHLPSTPSSLSASAGSGSGKSDHLTNSQFRRALRTLIATLTLVAVIELSFAVILGFYAMFRTQIQQNFVVSFIVGLVWIFVTPVTLTPIYALALNTAIKASNPRSRSGTNHQHQPTNSNTGAISDSEIGVATLGTPSRGGLSAQQSNTSMTGTGSNTHLLRSGSDLNVNQLAVNTSHQYPANHLSTATLYPPQPLSPYHGFYNPPAPQVPQPSPHSPQHHYYAYHEQVGPNSPPNRVVSLFPPTLCSPSPINPHMSPTSAPYAAYNDNEPSTPTHPASQY